MTKTYTFDEQLVSDLHKDAYGYRPCQSFWEDWAAGTDDTRQATWDDLVEDVEREAELERAENQRRVDEFEAKVATQMSYGAADRQTAIVWILDSMGPEFLDDAVRYDGDWMTYTLGLPYRYDVELKPALDLLLNKKSR